MITIIYLISGILAQYNRLLLIDSPAVDMNCLAVTNRDNNGFFGEQFFYPTLSNNGSITQFNQVTFTGFILFNKYNIYGGKQIIFYFVDGYENTLYAQPYVNLGLSLQYKNNILRLQVLTGKPMNQLVVQELMLYNNQNTDQIPQQWFNFVVSVNIQTDQLQFLNVKFYGMQDGSFWNYQVPYIQNNTFTFTFSQLSRITNEKLFGYDTDTRLCGSLAKFNMYLGFSTMDQEYYVDYEAQPLHLLRGINSLTSQLSLPLTSAINYEFIEGTGIRMFMNTQILYTFPQQYDNLTISFWMFAATINEFQILSLVESNKQSISLGLGIDSKGYLILYSQSSKIQVPLIGKRIWQQIGLSFTRRYYNSTFSPQTTQTIVKVVLNGRVQQSQLTLLTVTNFKYLILGQTFPQDQDSQYIDINDLRIYWGFSFIQMSNYNCSMYVSIGNKSPCIRCAQLGSQFCLESPIPINMDITTYYDCPAGYQETTGCPPATINNCSRQTGSICNYCNYGYQLQDNQCIIQDQLIVSQQDCSNRALYCQISNQQQQVMVCDQNLQYSKNKCNSISTYIPGYCSHVYLVNSTFLGCYNCILGSSNLGFNCVNNCASQNSKYKITNQNWCSSSCPQYYDYYRNCTTPATQVKCVSSCSDGQLLNNIDCIYKKQMLISKKTESCQFSYNKQNKLIKNYRRILPCDNSCKYCFHSGSKGCLSCSNPNFYFDPYNSQCLSLCDINGILSFSDTVTKQCVSQCDSSKYIQGSMCYKSCPTGYYPYNQQCLSTNPLNTYLDTVTKQYKVCPIFCYTCVDGLTCTKCLTNYFLVNKVCQLTCYPLSYYDSINDCVSVCPIYTYQYSNTNLNGYPISQCFQNGCGSVWAGITFQTYLHQSKPYQCVLNCDPGYFGDKITAVCVFCTNDCQTCSGSSSSCTSCVAGLFLKGIQCLSSCPKYQDYTTWACVASCPSGSYITEQGRACLSACGQYLPLYNKTYLNNCYDTPPAGIGCDATNQCYQCDEACVTCNGPNNTNCLSCYPDTFLLNNYCVTDCGTLQYDLKLWVCASTCSTGTYKQGQYCSITCLNGYYQFGTACYESTPPGAFCLYSSSKRMNLCDPCYTGCKTCISNSPNDCGSCLSGYYFYQNQCLSTCPSIQPIMDSFTNLCANSCASQYYLYDNICQTTCTIWTYKVQDMNVCFSSGCGNGYYAQSESSGCYPCDSACTLCKTISTNCQGCSSFYFLSGSTCQSQCPSDTPILNQITQTCVTKCQTSSYTYENPITGQQYCMASCPKYQMGILKCVDECPITYFPNPKICEKCYQTCAYCTGSSLNQCTQCISGYYLNDTSCVPSCPVDKPLDVKIQKCTNTCSGYAAQGICLEQCPSYLLYYKLNNLKLCVDTCYEGSFNLDQYCTPCAKECINCYGTSNTQCTACAQPYYILQTSCLEKCPSGYYEDMVTLTCQTYCLVTQFIYYNLCIAQCPPNMFSYEQNCISTCPSFTFVNGQICQDCDPQCIQCYGLSNQECTLCNNQFYLQDNTCSQNCPIYYDDLLNRCVQTCTNSQFLISDTLRCVSSCPSQYLLSNNTCVRTCPSGQYQEGSNCQVCDSKCSTCEGSPTFCTSCPPNLVLDINQCVTACKNPNLYIDLQNQVCQSRCPNGLLHYQPPKITKKFCVETCPLQFNSFCMESCPNGLYSLNGECFACPNICLTCTAANNCQTCAIGYYLNTINNLSNCQTTCDARLEDVSSMICVDKCLPSQVQYLNQCLLSCPTQPPLLQYNLECILECPKGSFRYLNQCNTCSSQCTECFGPSSTQCVACSLGYYLYGNDCTTICGSELYDQVNNICVKTCGPLLVQNGQTCISGCPIVQYGQNCLTTCPNSTFQMGQYCVNCQVGCQDCDIHGCLKCISGYLNNHICGTFCPLYYDDINMQCVSACPEKSLTLFDHCLSECPLPYYEYKGYCNSNCPTSTYQDYDYKCIDCEERCYQCDKNNCFICNDGYYLYESRCLVQCPISLKQMDIINGVCRSSCPNNLYTKGNYCVDTCDLLILNTQCISQCHDGYYQSENICAQCQSQCKTCETILKCTSCNSNYYQDGDECNLTCPNLINQILQKCTDDCSGVIAGKYCLTQCPQNLLQYQSSCIQQCPKGYFQDNSQCTQCPSSCLLCTTQTICSSCSFGYYLNNQQCISQCPIGLYGDQTKRLCVNVCPIGNYKHMALCVFSCPKPYVQSGDLCATRCQKNEYRNGYICHECSIECDECTDFGNEYCDKCAQGFTLQQKKCIGSCPLGYYMKDSCRKCDHQCSSCDINGCLTCRGDRNLNDFCKCSVGYYDDGVQDQCQKCPCPECTSPINCTKCINNLKPPNCSCDKQLNEEYCINCDVAQVTIYFTNSLNFITVDFSLLININLHNPFDHNDCQYLFINFKSLGTGSICYLDWNRTQIHIGLGQHATIQIGDTLQFQPNMIKYVNDEECQNFISTFINSTILEPAVYLLPFIMFDVQPLLSSCMENKINQISINGTGNREVRIISWNLQEFSDQDHFWQIKDFLSTQKNNLVIPSQTLRPNFTYYIEVKYVNFLGKLNQTLLVMKTIAQNLPYISLNEDTLQVYVFDCLKTYLDLQGPFQINYIIFYNGTQILQELVDVTKKLSYKLPVDNLPKGVKLRIDANIQESQYSTNFTLPFQDYLINFTQPDRFLGTIFNITSKAYDLDVPDSIQSFGFTYEWLCINKYNLNPCKNRENKIITFDNSRILMANLDISNFTLLFYVRASKNNRYSIAQQTVIISELNQECEYVQNNGSINGYINPNDMVAIQLKEQQTTTIILQDDQIITSKQVNGINFKFIYSKIAQSNNHIIVFLLPGRNSLRFALNKAPVILNYTIDPKQGHPLDKFNYNITVDEKQDQIPYTYNIYYYLFYVVIYQDFQQNQHINGHPVVIDGTSNGSFTLPSGIADQKIHILIEVKSKTGSISQVLTNLSISLETFTIVSINRKLMNFFNNETTLSDIFNGLKLLHSQTQQVCLKQCSGVGVCINKVCQCPSGYYFEDCSGSKLDYEAYINQFQSIYQKVLESDVSYQNYILYISSLNYLRKLSFLNTSETQSQSILDVLSNNVKYRLNKINNFTIGIQAQNTSEFNFNSMDIKSIVNQIELQTTLNSTSLVWGQLLQNFSNYEIQYKLRNIIGNTIELYLQSLLSGESANLTYDACRIIINRTYSIDYIIGSQSKHRLLAQYLQYFDVIQTLYLKNLYCSDGYFPYETQCNPVYDYKIRQQNRLNNIQLQNSINYSFPVDDSQIYVCIQRDSSTYNWINTYCTSKLIKQLLYCNCTLLAPTTYVQDILFIYSGSQLYRITVPNIIIFSYLLQLLAIFIASLIKVKVEQTNKISAIKFGKVTDLRRKRRVQIENQINQTDESSHNPISQNEEIDIQENIKEHKMSNDNKTTLKYSLSRFHHYHYFFRIIYKPKQLVPQYFRFLAVCFRWSAALVCASFLANQTLTYNIAIYPSLGVIVALRIFDSAFENTYKQSSYLKNYINQFLILLVIVLSNLIFIILILYQSFNIDDQTDWFISYYIALIIDFLIIDLILLVIQRYLGTDIRKKLKKKIQEAKNIQKLQEQTSRSQNV